MTHENLNFSRWMTHNNLSKCWSNSPVNFFFFKRTCVHTDLDLASMSKLKSTTFSTLVKSYIKRASHFPNCTPSLPLLPWKPLATATLVPTLSQLQGSLTPVKQHQLKSSLLSLNDPLLPSHYCSSIILLIHIIFHCQTKKKKPSQIIQYNFI